MISLDDLGVPTVTDKDKAQMYINAAIHADKDPPTPRYTERLESADNEIYLDLDDSRQVSQFLETLEIVEQLFKVTRVRIWPSRHMNVHVVISLETPLPLGCRLAIATAMGSDVYKTLFTVLTQKDFLFKPNKFMFVGTTDPDTRFKASLSEEVPF